MTLNYLHRGLPQHKWLNVNQVLESLHRRFGQVNIYIQLYKLLHIVKKKGKKG